jgi:hypothetical protein
MATIEQVRIGLASYIDNEILPAIPGGTMRKVVIGTAATMLIVNLEKTLTGALNNPAMHTLGIVKEDGTINVDALADSLRKNVPDEGMRLNLDIMGFRLGEMTFKRQDIDRLREHIVNS